MNWQNWWAVTKVVEVTKVGATAARSRNARDGSRAMWAVAVPLTAQTVTSLDLPIFPFRTASTFSPISSPPPSASWMPHTWMFARREYCSTLSALISWLSTFSSRALIRESFASSRAVSWLVRLFRASILSDISMENRACLSLAIRVTWGKAPPRLKPGLYFVRRSRPTQTLLRKRVRHWWPREYAPHVRKIVCVYGVYLRSKYKPGLSRPLRNYVCAWVHLTSNDAPCWKSVYETNNWAE